MDEADVIVVGAGVMGAATANALARKGREVVILERFEAGHTHGSSHGVARIFRFSYHEERYVRMAMESLPLWRRLEEESGMALLSIRGGIDVGTGAMAQHADALAAAGAVHEHIDGAEVARRYPFIRIRGDESALFQPDAGIVLADDTVRALVSTAPAAEVRRGERVRRLAVEGDGAVVETETQTHRARVVVVTAGAWAKGLLDGVGYELPVIPTCETVAFFAIPEEESLPAFIDWRDPTLYSLPSPGEGLKVGEFRVGPTIDPDEPRPGPNEESIARMSAWVAERFPTADPAPHKTDTCLYTNTSDEDFVLERRGPFVIGSPCSGHGFKFAPLIGERLAGLAEGR